MSDTCVKAWCPGREKRILFRLWMNHELIKLSRLDFICVHFTDASLEESSMRTDAKYRGKSIKTLRIKMERIENGSELQINRLSVWRYFAGKSSLFLFPHSSEIQWENHKWRPIAFQGGLTEVCEMQAVFTRNIQ